ncbi:MAG: hypothetical protein P8177_09795 [Gemmatimonadota bacterium]
MIDTAIWSPAGETASDEKLSFQAGSIGREEPSRATITGVMAPLPSDGEER